MAAAILGGAQSSVPIGTISTPIPNDRKNLNFWRNTKTTALSKKVCGIPISLTPQELIGLFYKQFLDDCLIKHKDYNRLGGFEITAIFFSLVKLIPEYGGVRIWR